MFGPLQFQKNTLATKFPLRLDGEYHPFVSSKPRVTCELCMFNERYMEDVLIRTEKKKLESELRRKGILYVTVNKLHRNCLNVSRCIRCNDDICAQCF